MIYNLLIEKPYEHVLIHWQERLKELGPVQGEEFSIRYAIPEDGLLLDIRDEQRDTFDKPSYDYLVRTHAHLNILTPMNYTIFHGDKLMLMTSIIIEATRVAEISFLVDKNLPGASKIVRFNMIKLFKQAIEDLPFPRIQARVKSSFQVGRDFVEKMGMEKEGVLRQFGVSGEDYIMYGLIK